MSTASHSPTAGTNSGSSHNSSNNASQQTSPTMLDKYLAHPPIITEELAFPRPPRAAKKVVAERRRKAAEFISGWEAEWERMG